MKKNNDEVHWVQVDAYMVASNEVETYTQQREQLAEQALAFFGTFCAQAERQWAGSEDGEAVVGSDASGEIRALIHLDPDGIALMQTCDTPEALHQALLDYNEISQQTYEAWLKELS